jgi:hypothetical protein
MLSRITTRLSPDRVRSSARVLQPRYLVCLPDVQDTDCIDTSSVQRHPGVSDDVGGYGAEWRDFKQARVEDKRFPALRWVYVSRSIGGVDEAAFLAPETVDKVKEIFGRRELEVVYVPSKD